MVRGRSGSLFRLGRGVAPCCCGGSWGTVVVVVGVGVRTGWGGAGNEELVGRRRRRGGTTAGRRAGARASCRALRGRRRLGLWGAGGGRGGCCCCGSGSVRRSERCWGLVSCLSFCCWVWFVSWSWFGLGSWDGASGLASLNTFFFLLSLPWRLSVCPRSRLLSPSWCRPVRRSPVAPSPAAVGGTLQARVMLLLAGCASKQITCSEARPLPDWAPFARGNLPPLPLGRAMHR